jgi:hypothetical protein
MYSSESTSHFADNLAEALAKFGLPRLPAGLARALEIHLQKLDEELGFAGDAHKYWPTSPAMRTEAAAQSSILADLEGFYGGFFFDKATRLPIRNQEEFDAVRNDLVGFKPTMTLIIETYQKVADAFYRLWEKSGARYEAFAEQLNLIRKFAIERCRARWSGRGDWFDRLPLSHAMAQLESETAAWRDKARNFEQGRCYESEDGRRPARKRQPQRKPGEAMVKVSVSWLKEKIAEVNKLAKKKGQKQLTLTPGALAHKSPPGGPHRTSWGKLLAGEPIRRDVLEHLVAFFEQYGVTVTVKDIPISEN